MRFSLVLGILALVINGLFDYGIYRYLKSHCRSKSSATLHAVSSAVMALLLLATIVMPKSGGDDTSLICVMWMLFAYVTFYAAKYVFVIFCLLAHIPNLWHHKAIKPLSVLGAVLAVVLFALAWWGALFNRYNIQVRAVDVPVADLPDAFDGFTIAQISDLHVGSFGGDTVFVSNLVDSVNALRPDLIVFTGDIVNRRSEEFVPFRHVMSRLKAPYGVFSIMGNHDYGDYSTWPSDDDKDRDVASLKQMEEASGMHMLNNSASWLHAGGDSIVLIGVENIGEPPFKVYGDLHKAYPDINDSNVKILLTHNPEHWEDDIEDKDANVALTLSGHTHAMQVELFGVSPCALRYDKWGGMYTDDRGQVLYVNIGAGTVGMPFRIGATPEITILKLVPKRD